MLADYAAVVGGLLLLLGGGALLLGRRWRLHQPGLRLLIVLLTLSLPSFALERRHAEFVTVAANETVDDTLLAAGNTVRRGRRGQWGLVGFCPDPGSARQCQG